MRTVSKGVIIVSVICILAGIGCAGYGISRFFIPTEAQQAVVYDWNVDENESVGNVEIDTSTPTDTNSVSSTISTDDESDDDADSVVSDSEQDASNTDTEGDVKNE